MIADPKERADVLLKQLDMAWTNFDRRRAYEWKLSLAIWTAMAAFIALSIKEDVQKLPLEILAAATLIVVIHVFFNIRVKMAIDVDKMRAYLYEELLNKLVGVTFKTEQLKDDSYKAIAFANEAVEAIQGAISAVTCKDKWWHKLVNGGWWSAWFHVGITIVLILTAVVLLQS